MNNKNSSRLRFNFGFLLEAPPGTIRDIELNYPTIQVGPDVILTPLKGKFQATRTTNGIYLKGQLESSIPADCVRCLEAIALPITIQLDDLFYYPASSAPEGEFTIGEDTFVDLSPLVRELSLLEIPMQHYCRPDCRGMCAKCGQNLNEGSCDCEQDEIDPRLAALKSLLDS